MKDGWTYKKLGEIGATQTGTTPSKTNSANYGDYIPFIRPAEIPLDGSGKINYNTEIKLSEEGIKNGRLFKANSVLMVCIGSIGKLGHLEHDASCNQQINVLTPNAEYDSKYIFYAMSAPAFQKESQKIAQGAQATLPIINKSKWSNLIIPIPPSLLEQKRIVSCLDAAFAKIDALKANAEKRLSEVRKLFQKALEEAMKPKEGWKEKTLGELASDMYRGSGIKRDQVTKDGIPCVRYGEIYTTYNVAFEECVSHTHEDMISSPKYFEHGDLLFAITGESVEDIGKTIAYLGKEKCLCGGDIICMKHKQNAKFLSYALSTPDAIRQKGIGKTKLKVVHTNAPALKAICVPIPSLDVQQQIVDRLDALSTNIKKLEEVQRKTITECDALKQAMLREVFE